MTTLIDSEINLKMIRGMACLGCLGLISTAYGNPTPSSALLTCHVTYAGSTHLVEARPVSDPYSVPSLDIGGRFRFKAVMMGQARHVESIAIYAYLDTAQQPILIHQAVHMPPYRPSKVSWHPYNLTGRQHLYAGPVERELIYHCMLRGVQP